MNDITLFLTIVMAGLSCILLIVSFASWHRLRSVKFLFVSIAFVGFFIKAILLIFEIIIQDEKAVIIDSIILILLYLSIIKK